MCIFLNLTVLYDLLHDKIIGEGNKGKLNYNQPISYFVTTVHFSIVSQYLFYYSAVSINYYSRTGLLVSCLEIKFNILILGNN